jgi:predicted DsbA family dithiol-disulfide isomerase
MSATPASAVSVRIDFVSDVVCPWCAIGLASLEQALARLQGEVQAEIHIRPFELNPGMGPEGEDIAGHLQAKYGMTPTQLAENQERIRARGAELGIVFGPRTRTWNTFDAHRLLHWAGIEGNQLALKRVLLRAYFADGANVSDHATLARIAGEAGLDVDRAAGILASDAYAAEVRAEEAFFQRNGINGVPAIIIDQARLISGGQPVEVFEAALRDIAAAKAT